MVHNNNYLKSFNFHCIISNIYDHICYLDHANFRYDDGRVIMGALGNRTCAVTVNPVLYKDVGIWNINRLRQTPS